jgi:hypothetical protein
MSSSCIMVSAVKKTLGSATSPTLLMLCAVFATPQAAEFDVSSWQPFVL